MATAMIGAALSVVRTALSPLTDSLLEKWAASKKLGSNVKELELQLLAVKALLEHTAGKEIVDNSALKNLLVTLQDLGYDAEDVLDELDYFRIQDKLGGTSDAADKHAKGCAHNLLLNVHHTAKAVGKQICLPSCFSATAPGTKGKAHSNSTISLAPHANQANREASGVKANLGKCFPCSSLPSVDDEDDYYDSPQRNQTNDEPPKLRFNRVDASTRMKHVVEQLRTVREIISSTITTLGPNCITVRNIAQNRPVTISKSIETKLYGRDTLMEKIIHQITEGKHSGEVLTVIPIVGLGGIGKTTLAQHIYHSEKVQKHFEVKVWTCVSLNFNVNKLLQEIEKQIPKVEVDSGLTGEKKGIPKVEVESGTTGELIGKRLKNKRFLVVLDDIWDCNSEEEWEQLLVPFKMSQVLGNIIVVTTRIPAQAEMVTTVDPRINLEALDDETLKKLFLDFVFGDQSREDKTILIEIGDKIVSKLKGSPLAAKTVGRILRNQLDVAHWNKVLESKEWEQKVGINDIMPALKLSYYYLPSHLQLCFPYCGLFPQDYKFEREELINFWIGLEVLHSSHGENKRIEDIGLSHLAELVSYGFLERKENRDGSDFYTIHDLLHELARKVSSHECLSIDSSQSQVSSLHILPSIRHLSINIDDTSVEDRLARKTCAEDFNTLDKKIKVEKLRSLMLFGNHHGCFVKAFSNLFREAMALRVILLSDASYDVEHLLHNFYNLVHLRYLRIGSHPLYESRFPTKISRFYQMMVLDARQCDIIDLPRGMSNLAKLRHFLVKDATTHSSIVEVGKLQSLQELRSFVVKQEGQGFELRQIGHLEEICGSLCIDNLAYIETMEEIDEAKLMQKSRLHELILCQGKIYRSTNTLDEHLERLKPSSNLLKLSIKRHRGTNCPSWLGTNLSVRSLESLCLEDVTWKKFPPIGELLVDLPHKKNISGSILDSLCLEGVALNESPPIEELLVDLPHEENILGSIPDRRFGNLRRLKLCKLTMVKKWVVHAPCLLFPFLEVLIIKDCPQLVELSFQHFGCCQQGKEVNVNLFPRLEKLKIRNCPQLLSFPPVPWVEAPCSINIEGTGSSCIGKLVCEKISNSEYGLTIEGKKDTNDSTFWNVLAFHNLTGLKVLRLLGCESLPLRYLQMLSSLRTLQMSCPSNTFPFVEADSHVQYQFPVESLVISEWNASGKELTQLLVYFPKLSDLQLWQCKKVTGLAVNVKGQRATETPGPSSSANINKVEQQQGTRAEDDVIVTSEEAERGLLLLPPQLQELRIEWCPKLMLLCSNPHDDSNEEDGGGLRGLTSLRWLEIRHCPKLLFSCSSSSFSSSFPFPNSLEDLHIHTEQLMGMDTLVPVSNLTSLTSLSIGDCGDLGVQGLSSLLAQGHLTKLSIKRYPYFSFGSANVQLLERLFRSSKLQELEIDDVAGFTPAPIHHRLPSSYSKLQELTIDDVAGCTAAFIPHRLIFSSLTKLEIYKDNEVKSFTEEEEALLFVDSLEDVTIFHCDNLQSLPKWLHRLPNLKRLRIRSCRTIQIWPKGGLPSSLEELEIDSCPEIQSLPERLHRLPNLKRLRIRSCRTIQMWPKDGLPSSLEELEIDNCPEIQSLSKDCLPESLQKLEIQNCPAIQSLPKVDDLPSSLREIDVHCCGSEELMSQCRMLKNIIPTVRANFPCFSLTL